MPSCNLQSRLTLDNYLLTHPLSYTDRGEDVILGLSQPPKSLPPHYFYDDLGSMLFEKICTLPEYYPTRTEAQILAQQAPAIAHCTGPCDLMELGSGSSTKTRLLLDAYTQLGYGLHYLPVDVSEGLLTDTAQALLEDYPQLTIHGLVSTYELAFAELPPPQFSRRLMVFLGSTLGNFSPGQTQQFFQQVQGALQTGDYFLLGVDLQKPVEIIEAAYNDSQGITAEFNLNMLRHLNWRFEGNFNLDYFQHRAIFNTEKSQIEMYLVSQVPQTVSLKKLALTVQFEAGESLLTEISRKFNLQTLVTALTQYHLPPQQVWTDPQHWFGLLLCQRQS
ncbi:L-histidine N(alpha)-methyltransferase [Synechocystis sp. LKSZ1]|uniref:L-histidine N(alpha)-methyltransferase n=1 Tax=Synechocystis sp. LKSZ1 TaxID=3144951 RepID=UPI00336BF46B